MTADGSETGESATGSESPSSGDRSTDARSRRPWLERLGLAAIAAVLAMMFAGVAAASWIGGEPFLAVMGGIGCLMTVWVGALTVLRG